MKIKLKPRNTLDLRIKNLKVGEVFMYKDTPPDAPRPLRMLVREMGEPRSYALCLETGVMFLVDPNEPVKRVNGTFIEE